MPFKGPFHFFGSSTKTAAPAASILPTFDSSEGKVENYQDIGKATAEFKQPGSKSKIIMNFIGMTKDQVQGFLGDEQVFKSAVAVGDGSWICLVEISLSDKHQKELVNVNILSQNPLVCSMRINTIGSSTDDTINLWVIDSKVQESIKQKLQAQHDISGDICIVKDSSVTSFADMMSRAQATYRTHQCAQEAAEQAAELCLGDDYEHVDLKDIQSQSFMGASAATIVPEHHANFASDSIDDPEFGASAGSTSKPVAKPLPVKQVLPITQVTRVVEEIPLQDLSGVARSRPGSPGKR